MSASAALSTTGMSRPANASPTGTNARAKEPSCAELDAPRSRAAAEHAIDLAQRGEAHVAGEHAALRERAQDGAHAARVAEHRERARRLLLRAPAHRGAALRVEHVRRLEPEHEALEVVQRVGAAHTGVGVHEVEPQALGDERERGTFAAFGAAERRATRAPVRATSGLRYPAARAPATSAGSPSSG